MLSALLAGLALADPPSPPTGGFPDSGKECQFAAEANAPSCEHSLSTGCSGSPALQLRAPPLTRSAADHIINNVTEAADGTLRAEPLNDANGVFQYKGLYHVM